MAGYDFRTEPEAADSLSFYLFDNLKMQDMGEGGNVYRFDTMQEAITGFRMVQAAHPDWTIALGASAGERDIDLVHRRQGRMNVLLDDHMRIPFWAERGDVAQAIREFSEGPGIDRQTDRELLGAAILVPYAPEGEPEDRYLADKALLPRDPEDAASSISECYVEGRGWIDLDALAQIAREYERSPDNRPVVTRLNVAYETTGWGDVERGRTGYADIAPAEFRGMEARFREFMDVREQERRESLAAEGRVSPPVPDSALPDTGQPFFSYATNYGETEKVNIGIGVYGADDNLYVAMSYFDRDLGGMDFFGDVTVNITKMQPFMACIDVNNNGEKIVDFLVENGFGEPAGRSLPSGFCMYPVFRFNPEKLREADPRGFEQYCKAVGIEPVTKGQVVCHAEVAEDSLDEAKRRAKTHAQERNAERPDRQSPKDRGLEL